MTEIQGLVESGQALAAWAGSDAGRRHPELAVRALMLALLCGLAALDLLIQYCKEVLCG